ncbi:hypothetical protein NBRC116583_00980 [Arenicella sp. 4NH20-0111]|uniref:energy transducer TonB n=1 Tax=Arenicella sp. 4NH20-0111 TaxID=3127648 RepID=UPI00310525FB
MSEQAQAPSVLLISDDSNVVESIINGNSTELTINARETVDEVLKQQDLLDGNAIIILDCDSSGNTEKAIEQAVQLKKADPTQVLMLVGEKEPLAEILKSNIQPIVYRAFNKPISGNQVFLAFKSALSVHEELVAKQEAGEDIMVVGPAENQANLDQLAAQKKTSPAVYAAIGVVALGLIAFLFLGGDDEQPQQVVVDNSLNIEQEAEQEINQAVSQTNELNQFAANAILDGRYIEPESDNALHYYNQALQIDPYDTVAYEGKKTVAAAVRANYDTLVAESKFDQALKAINALREIEPLNLENDQLSESLSQAITERVKEVQANGTKEEIDATTATLARLGEFDSENSASKALQEEQNLLDEIDDAIAGGNLVPPKKGNAYQMVSSALKGNKISRANSEPRVQLLSDKLLALANTSLGKDNLEEAVKLSALLKRINLNSDNPGITKLNDSIKSKRAAIAAANAAEEEKAAPVEEVAKVEEIKPEPPKIIPAKVISRSPPRYPNRALKSNTEGWVQVRFSITKEGIPVDIEVVDSKPKKVFDDAAVKSVKKWRFSPARNQRTGLPVDSKNISTKVQFRLG